MNRFCIFCGKRPKGKSNEHVLPQWLIELTGDPNRTWTFRHRSREDSAESVRTYSAKAFKFPSCEACNARFSALEVSAKPIVCKVLADDHVSPTEFSTLFDWFDKIRIGLWLAFLYLHKNFAGIEPHFYVQHRIGLYDRMLAIFKMDGTVEGLTFIGCDMPSFYYTPSCFSLRINNYCFLNMSCLHLLSRRIGFPYPVESFMEENEGVKCLMAKGRHRVMMPLLKRVFSLHGTELYQPMFPGHGCDDTRGLYDMAYVRDHSLSWEHGIGKVFIRRGTSLQEYPDSRPDAWVPAKTYPPAVLMFNVQLLTLECQTYVDSLAPSLKGLSKEKKSHMNQQLRTLRRLNAQFSQALRSKAQELGLPAAYLF